MLEKSKVKAQCTLQIHARHGQQSNMYACDNASTWFYIGKFRSALTIKTW